VAANSNINTNLTLNTNPNPNPMKVNFMRNTRISKAKKIYIKFLAEEFRVCGRANKYRRERSFRRNLAYKTF